MFHKNRFPINLEEAKQYMKSASIDAEEGHVYNIYKCGHIFDSEEDNRYTSVNKYKKSNRKCPICEAFIPLLVKYKLCGCGTEQIGYAQQPSLCCGGCSNERKTRIKALHPGETYHNQTLVDPKRWNCVNRDKCLEKYAKHHQAIPCKNCNDYTIDPKWSVK